VRAHLDLANLYVKKRAYDQALALYEDLLKRNPKLVPGYTSAGIIYDAKGDRQKANEYYQKALKIDPKFVPALNNLAWNYAEHGGNLTMALAHAKTAQEAEPNNPQVADTLGWIYFKTQDYTKAVDLLRESAEKIPENPVVRYHLGMACYKKSDLPCAREALQQALRLSRDFPEAEEAKQTLAEIRLLSN
jgi:tetratricopeptide (TPR) repeat protein